MSQEWLDRSRKIREGEGLDLAKLETYLKEQKPEWTGSLELEQFPSGHSNLTYLLRIGDVELVLRRPPFGAKKIKKGHDMGREYRMLSHLVDSYGRVPKPHLMCEDESIIGAPFYLMERVQGIIIRSRLPKGMTLTAEQMNSISTASIDNLADIHGIDIQAAGLSEFGKPEGYIQRQVEGWTRRYLKAKTDEVPEIEKVAKWLADNMPEKEGAAVIHNDYKYDNLVLDPNDLGKIIAVLDWEMATIGDPLMDLGTTLGYWIDPNDHEELLMLPLTFTQPGNLTRREVVERYADRSGQDLSGILFHYVYALFKIAGILQQIYLRYKQGDTQDPRFAAFGYVVQLFGKIADRAIEKNRIDDLW